MVRAFKSTLEDLEEKRSVHSFQSLHSLRSSRSQSHKPLSDELEVGARHSGPYLHAANVHPDRNAAAIKTKSRSVENVPLMEERQPTSDPANANRTMSSTDISKKVNETTI